MKIDEITQASLLYDFYGQLLSKRQREVMALYHEENLTLSEIAGEFSISRQGVHDALKNAEKALNEYETKLGLVAKFRRSREAVDEIDTIINGVIARLQGSAGLAAKAACGNAEPFGKGEAMPEAVIKDLKKVKEIIDNLEESSDGI